MTTINSGSHCAYYHAQVEHPENPNQKGSPYEANCEDVIKALELTFDEACEFKSIWRRARARQGFVKAESDAIRDATKALHYAGRVLRTEQQRLARLSSGIDVTSDESVGLEFVSRYDWSVIPDAAQWAATDADGRIFAYKEKPTALNYSPVWSGGGQLVTNTRKPVADWRDTLEARPQ